MWNWKSEEDRSDGKTSLWGREGFRRLYVGLLGVLRIVLFGCEQVGIVRAFFDFWEELLVSAEG